MNILKQFIPVKLKTFLKKRRDYNAIDSLDKKLKKYLNFKNGFFIECGANDGVNQSNTWYFEKKLNWRGILIEPVPNLFKELIKNRSENNIFVNKCLVEKNYKSKNINMIYDNCKTKISKSQVKTLNTQVSTVAKVLKDNKIKKSIDLFSLDVEGYELNVLNGINFRANKIKYFLIETKNFNKLNKFLYLKNYRFIKKLSRHDYLFKSK